MRDSRFTLAPGSQVREEDFGLLFYTMAGPRLYFLSSGDWIGSDFFQGVVSLEQCLRQHTGPESVTDRLMEQMTAGLNHLKEKGVILEY